MYFNTNRPNLPRYGSALVPEPSGVLRCPRPRFASRLWLLYDGRRLSGERPGLINRRTLAGSEFDSPAFRSDSDMLDPLLTAHWANVKYCCTT